MKPDRPKARIVVGLALMGLICGASIGLVSTTANAYAFTGCTLSPQRYQNLGGMPFSSEVSAAVSAWNVTDANLLSSSTATFKVTYRNDGASGYDGKSVFACGSTPGAAWINIYYTNSYSVTKRKCVWIHEIGHVMGMAHSSVSNAIMNSVSTSNYNLGLSCQLVSDDTQGMNALY
ncbi:MAG: hypothetical protein RI885_1281 [Actinomycetota bacterium]|jgi:hypothetical protein